MIDENTVTNRRNLRRQLERRSIDANAEFLCSFRDVRDAVQSVAGVVDSMNVYCSTMTDRLRLAKQQTQDLLGRTMALQQKRYIHALFDENAKTAIFMLF